MPATYEDPLLSVLVLDFLKEAETRMCLESIRRHVKVPHRVVYHHNGPGDYPAVLLKDGLVDQLVQTRVNWGLGLGTRALFAATFSPYSLYLQNDQFLIRDYTEYDLGAMAALLDGPSGPGRRVVSISLAGAPCGDGVYSERAHLIRTDVYRAWEGAGCLGYHGAGPFHEGPWREEQIQTLYRAHGGVHMIWPQPFVADNGSRAIRENPDGSLWQHYPDTKALWLLRGPVKQRHVYPRFTENEWTQVIETQAWPAGAIPEAERKESFHVWH